MLEVFFVHFLQMGLYNPHLLISNIAFANLSHGGHYQRHNLRLVCECAHLRGMLEEYSPTFPDSYTARRAVCDKDDVGRYLGT